MPENPDTSARVVIRFDASIATIVLNDPDRRNAMSHGLFDDLEHCLAEAERATDSKSCHVLRIRGEGPAFCAGFDLDAMADGALPSFLERLGAICRRLRHLDAVVVAEVHGPALAGGCALVSACDIVHAGPDAAFGYPVHRLGISPAVSLATLVPGTSPGAARALTLSGEFLDADAAVEVGLAAAAHPDRGALEEAEVRNLAFSARLITLEIGMRFLTDHLEGDVYFKVHRVGHNLDRARNQFALVRSMEAQASEMEQVVEDCRACVS